MYLMDADKYECDYCGFQQGWNDRDDRRGDIWECENCFMHFCTKCFQKQIGKQEFSKMLSLTDHIICPDCFKRNAFGVRDEIAEGEARRGGHS